MTQFQPVSESHAIERVAFVLRFDRPPQSGHLETFRKRHDLWSEDLPAVREPKAVKIVAAPDFSVQVDTLPGIEFANLRPDGTPVWALRWMGQELIVECTRYTRWVKVSSLAAQHLGKAIDLIASFGLYNTKAVGLVVVDAFVAEGEGDVSGLLRRGDLLPHHVFGAGPNWHVHTGRFLDITSGHVLSNVNVDVACLARAEAAVMQHRVGITHVLNQDYDDGAPDLIGWMSDRMERFHQCNKAMLSELLTDFAQSQVSLSGRSRS